MIQFLGKRQEQELVARLAVVMTRMLMWKTPAPTRSWEDTIATQRTDLAIALQHTALRVMGERLRADF